MGYFCSSKRSSKQAWQNFSYFITLTLHNVYPHSHNMAAAKLNIDSTSNDVIVTLCVNLSL